MSGTLGPRSVVVVIHRAVAGIRSAGSVCTLLGMVMLAPAPGQAQISLQNGPFTQLAHYFYQDAGWLENYSYDYLSPFGDSASDFRFADITVSMNTQSRFEITLRAPDGYAFQINPAPLFIGESRLNFVAGFGPAAGPGSSPGTLLNRTLVFENLSDPGAVQALALDASYLTTDGASLLLYFSSQVTAPVSFTGLTYSFDYDPADFATFGPLAFADGYFEYENVAYGSLQSDPGPRMTLVAAAIPEPSTYALMAGAIMLVLVMVRRRF